MKRLLMILFVMTWGVTSFAQKKFEFTFDLVKPTGNLDSASYFCCTLKNLTDTSYLFYGGETPIESKSNLAVEVMRKDGSTYTLFPIEGFRWGVPGTPRVTFIHLLESHDSTSYKIGLFRDGPELDGSYWGIIENNEEIMEQIAKVRIRMKDFRADNLVLLKPYSEDCLISNWVEIDSDEFIDCLRERKEQERIRAAKSRKWLDEQEAILAAKYNEKFGLILQLEKPTGKLDSASYFSCTLRNRTDTLYRIHSAAVDGNFPDGQFVVEVMQKDGTTYTLFPMEGFA